MAKLIPVDTITPAVSEPPKIIEEFIGRVNSEMRGISIAKMISPSASARRGRHRIDEYTVVLKGGLQVRRVSGSYGFWPGNRRPSRRMGYATARRAEAERG